MAEPVPLPPLPVRGDLPQPSEEEVERLAELIGEAQLRGIHAGAWTLARVILGAGYRLAPEPAPRDRELGG